MSNQKKIVYAHHVCVKSSLKRNDDWIVTQSVFQFQYATTWNKARERIRTMFAQAPKNWAYTASISALKKIFSRKYLKIGKKWAISKVNSISSEKRTLGTNTTRCMKKKQNFLENSKQNCRFSSSDRKRNVAKSREVVIHKAKIVVSYAT